MPPTFSSTKPFQPGTTGWTAADLDDPEIEGRWFERGYEIIEGVLTEMPPAYFDGGAASQRLIFLLTSHLHSKGLPAAFSHDVDMIIDETRVLRPDIVYMTPRDKARQLEASKAAGRPDPRRTRLLVPPTLIIESVSEGHELHDERTKLRWYAELGVRDYWLLNAYARTLRCLVLEGAAYRDDAAGKDADEMRPSCFPGLVIPLSAVWPE